MKRKILVPMFASVMALSMNTVANADEVKDNSVENKEEKTNTLTDIDQYEEMTYKKAVVKDGVAVKVRQQGEVQHIAYTGDEFKVLGTQGEWVKVKTEDGEGWLAARYVDLVEGTGYLTSDKVNLRKDTNTDSDVIEELEIGSTVKVLESNEGWIKVQKGEQEGYIRSLYISDEAPVVEEEEEVSVEYNVNNDEISTESESTTTNTETNTSTNTSTNTYRRPSSSSNTSSSSNGSTSNSSSSNESADSSSSSNESTSNSSSRSAQAVLNLAYSKMGYPYVWGAEGPNSFDCSGFTSYVYRNAVGISIPRTSSAQSGYGTTVSKSNLQPGDLVFFSTNGTGRVSHVGIYVGGGNMVHAPSSGKTISVTSINSSYYTSRFVTAKRVL
ncbi:C40 family peptidase [Asaccharospora irregularis]|uniref:Cell wall-associated hydrolase, NlpC family n=1 Tax=Asaccharospora irregularis DSM 2635 TaxID=1121321 RepID=A0A1M5PMT1_9FIRM|nr:C40 family peptidase [Asaccharospora irregularis]SHH03044.1 Cell wall-associated hydrolase, NlpC family [Asaccharospora irregularis DSM 2635]